MMKFVSILSLALFSVAGKRHSQAQNGVTIQSKDSVAEVPIGVTIQSEDSVAEVPIGDQANAQKAPSGQNIAQKALSPSTIEDLRLADPILWAIYYVLSIIFFCVQAFYVNIGVRDARVYAFTPEYLKGVPVIINHVPLMNGLLGLVLGMSILSTFVLSISTNHTLFLALKKFFKRMVHFWGWLVVWIVHAYDPFGFFCPEGQENADGICEPLR